MCPDRSSRPVVEMTGSPSPIDSKFVYPWVNEWK